MAENIPSKCIKAAQERKFKSTGNVHGHRYSSLNGEWCYNRFVDWILDRENRLNGTKVATIRIRPLRLAYIIPDDNPQIAVRAIHSCCLTWGGMINGLIPYSETKGFSPIWQKILNKLDPDNLVDCVGISETDNQRFEGKGQHIHRWDKPLESLFMVGALQYSAMLAFAKGLKDDQSQIIVQPRLDSNNPPYLPVITMWGQIDEQLLEETLRLQGVQTEIRYADLANIEDFNFSTETRDLFLQLHPEDTTERKSGVYHYRDFLSLTRAGLKGQSAPYLIGGGSPEDPQDEEAFVNTVLITGQNKSVSDLCLYWDLRIERLSTRFFPLWIPLPFLTTDDGLETVKRALQWTNDKQRGLSREPHLYIISTSVSKKTIEDKLNGKLEDAEYETRDLDRFISGKSDYYLSKEDKEVSFRNGSVRVPIPRLEELKYFAPWDRVVHEISFSDIRMPQSKSLKYHIGGNLLNRLTRRGIESFSHVFSWPDMIPINLPNYWTALESIFTDAGYDCEPSDKSVFALGILNLVGGIESLGVIASSKVYEMLIDMCRIRGQTGVPREFFAEREEFDYSSFKQKWGQNTDVILEWLIKKGVIFRGVRLKCPKCQLNKWYELDDLKKIWRCDGCLSDQVIPLTLNSVNWKYRINELYARGHDQGVISHLLAIYALHPAIKPRDHSVLGYHPGVKIIAKSDHIAQQTKIEQMELDLVSIRDGRLIIGECKGSGEKLTKEEVNRYARLANYLECSRILFVTPTFFPNAEQLFNATQPKCAASIEWWQKLDILDISIEERLGIEADEKISQEQKAAKYLDNLSYSIRTEVGQY